jgi:hypothetical protein
LLSGFASGATARGVARQQSNESVAPHRRCAEHKVIDTAFALIDTEFDLDR